MRVVVVGAGVVGLSCAVQLAEAGHEVAVLARDLPRETTSAVAAGWWYPYLAAPRERVLTWAAETYQHLDRLAATTPAAGVRQRESVQLLHRVEPDPAWASLLPSLHAADDLPVGYVAGWAFTAPVADTSVYLPYLAGRLTSAGGTLTRVALSALPGGGDAVVNASGLAARSLTGDTTLTPVRGQVVRLAGVTVERVWLDEGALADGSAMTYIVPREHDVVVGGTAAGAGDPAGAGAASGAGGGGARGPASGSAGRAPGAGGTLRRGPGRALLRPWGLGGDAQLGLRA